MKEFVREGQERRCVNENVSGGFLPIDIREKGNREVAEINPRTTTNFHGESNEGGKLFRRSRKSVMGSSVPIHTQNASSAYLCHIET